MQTTIATASCLAVLCCAVLCCAVQLMRSAEIQATAAAVHKAMGLAASVFLPNVSVSMPQGEQGVWQGVQRTNTGTEGRSTDVLLC
jgi:hypothetical protein